MQLHSHGQQKASPIRKPIDSLEINKYPIRQEIFKPGFSALFQLGIDLRSSTQDKPDNSTPKVSESSLSIYDYCDTFDANQNLEQFSRFLLNALHKISNAKRITLFLINQDQNFEAILEKHNKVFISGIKKNLNHSVELLIKHFRDGQYLLSQAENMIYLPIIIHERLIGFLQIVMHVIEQNTIHYLWRIIQKYNTLLAQASRFEECSTDRDSGLGNQIAFQRDFETIFSLCRLEKISVQLTLIALKKFHSQDSRLLIKNFGLFLQDDEQNRGYRLDDSVFAIIESQSACQDFTQKIQRIAEYLEKKATFSVASTVNKSIFSSAQQWLEKTILSLHLK